MPGPIHWGWWWVCPIMVPICMLVMALIFGRFLLGRGGCRPFWMGGHDSSAPHGHGEPESAIEVLKMRYAKGEITKDEFEQIRKDLVS